MGAGALQGWYTDPLGRHEARYFSGGRPTALVRDGVVEGRDDPPAGAPWVVTAVEAPPPPRPLSAPPAAERRRIPAHRAAAWAGSGLLALGLVAAVAARGGGGSGGGVPTDALAAYRTTVAAGSAHITSTLSWSSRDRAFGMLSTGDYSWADDEGTLTSTSTPWPPGNDAQAVTVHSIYQGPATWIRLDVTGIGNALPHGWFESILDGARRPPPSLLGAFFGGAFSGLERVSDPADVLALLAERSTTVTLIGHQVLDGAPTTHLQAQVPVSALAPGHLSAAQQQAAEEALGSDHLYVDFWVDDGDRLRQLGIRLTLERDPDPPDPAAHAASILSFPITVDLGLHLSAYGTPVHVSPPAPSQVTSITRCRWDAKETLVCNASDGAAAASIGDG